MNVDLMNAAYAAFGGIGLVVVTKIYETVRNRLTGRDVLVKYSTFIRRHASNRRELEELVSDKYGPGSIIMQGVDAAYIAVSGKDPSVIILYLRKPEDALLFRACLNHLDDPETVYALASRQKPLQDAAPECGECAEFTRDAKGTTEGTWLRFSNGRDITDEKVDDAMLTQAISLARSRDKILSQSGTCHISVKRQCPQTKHCSVIVLPTSSSFRKSFRKEYGTDDLTRFAAGDLYDKIIDVRRKMALA